ncbi:MAG: DUF2007 domain-containing protein [Spirosomataceae bacterium]
MPHRAELARILLTDRGIDAVVLNKKDSSYLFGKCELYVHNDNITLAKAILDAELPQD